MTVESHSERIRQWLKAPTPEVARNLIRLYSECEWRSTRLEIVRALSHFSDARTLSFLVDLIKRNDDLAEQELAVFSLARHQSRGSRIFLRQFYLDAPAHLKASAAFALGVAGIYEMSAMLLKDLKIAQERNDPAWLKSIVLSLGEMKEYRALPQIHDLLGSGVREQDLLFALMFALGRLERSVEQIKRHEPRFLEAPLFWQVFQASLAQVQIRSQLRIEDYLSKIFESEHPHPMLPMELKGFQGAEVQEGLSVFSFEQYWRRHLFCLRVFEGEGADDFFDRLIPVVTDWREFFEVLARSSETLAGKSLPEVLFQAAGGDRMPLEVRLEWINAFVTRVDFEAQCSFFLNLGEDRLSTQFLNLWSEASFSLPEAEIRKEVRTFLKVGLTDAAFSRLARACVELGVSEAKFDEAWFQRFPSSKSKSGLLMYAERFRMRDALKVSLQVEGEELKRITPRILALCEALAEGGQGPFDTQVKRFLEYALDTPGELREGALRVIRYLGGADFEDRIVQLLEAGLKDGSERGVLPAVIAAKAYPRSRAIAECLEGFLSHSSQQVRGRAFDSLLSNTSLMAKRTALRYFESNLDDEFLVDKFYRDFDPEKKGGDEFFSAIDRVLRERSDHPQWEKLVALRDRLKPAQGGAETLNPAAESAELKGLDDRLMGLIPGFQGLDVTAKLALRAAEQPFFLAETGSSGNLPIDKAPAVLEFCKALDLILERHVGQKILFPKLDRELHEFQTHWQRMGFGEEYPQGDRVLSLLGLKGRVPPEVFPLHKAKLMCGAFFNGRILQDRFKIFDGLRAWAVIFLVFARKIDREPLVKVQGLSDEKCVQLSKRLMQLQDLRNPAAHRQTYPELESLKVVRTEALELINLICG